MAVDIGNSDITLGIYNNDQWKTIWRIPSSLEQTELFYSVTIRNLFFESRLKMEMVDHIVVSSVVPDLTDRIATMLSNQFGLHPVVLGPDVYAHLPIRVLNPYQIGSDLVANALAAYLRYKRSCVVIDFGTALTFTILSNDGEVLGVTIAPGLKTAIRSLSQQTAKLFDVPLELPDSVLGKNTVHAIQAGILWGYEGMVLHMLQKIRSEVGDATLPAIATGGLSGIIKTLHAAFDVVEPNLTLEGLRIAGTLKVN